MKTKYVFIAILIILISGSAYALSPKVYTGINLSYIDYSDSELDFNFGTAGTKLGVLLSPNIAFEARYAAGIIDDSLYAAPIGYFDTSIEHTYGIYSRLIAPMSRIISLYVIIGYTWLEQRAEGEVLGVREIYTGTDEDTSFGLGIEANFTPRISASIEIMRLIEREGYDYTNFGPCLQILF